MSEKYSLLDAFLSLKDIDDDAALGMLKESKSFSINASNDDLAEAKEMLEDDDTEIEVIDPDADTIEHIKNKSDYVGQYILRCNKCKSNRFLDADKLVVDEDDDTQYNTEDECPNCHATGSGFELIGQVGKVAKDEPAEDQSAEEGTPGTPEGTLVDPVAVDAEFDNDLSSDEATFDNDVEFEEEETSTETAEDETASDTDGEEDLSRFDEPEEDDGMETDISEDDDSDVEEVTLGDEVEEKVKKDDEDVTEAFKPNDDIVKMNKYAKEAWLMNKVISSMNNEEAYYGTWLYYWPDGCDEEECALTFNDREALEDLREVFESVYKDYHEDDLYEADDETLAYAHKQDALLGLKKIDNIKRKSHVGEKLTEAFDGETLKDLFALFIDPDSIRVIEVYDSESGKCVYEGSYSELTPDIKASKLVKFGVGPEEYLDARISTGATGQEPALASVLAGFVEGKGKIALFDVLDDGEEEELQVRDAAEATTVYGNAQLIDLGTPRVLKLFLDCPQMVAIEEVEKDDTEKLVEAILDANSLSSYKIDKPTSAEYWIQESIYSGEDLDYIFENFVKAHEQLAYQFKKITGYRTSLEEHFEQENGITTIDELYQKLYNKDMLKLTEDVQETSAQDDAEKDESPAPEPAQDKPDASAEKDIKPEPSVNSFKTRKELAEAIQECKDANKAYRINRSDKAGYRYDLVEFFDEEEAAKHDQESKKPEQDAKEPEQSNDNTKDTSKEFTNLVDKLRSVSNYQTFVKALNSLNADQKKFFMQHFGKNTNYKIDPDNSTVNIPVANLIGTQEEIDWKKTLSTMFEYGCKSCTGSAAKAGPNPILSYKGKYVIDGHHRWSQIYFTDPEASAVCMNFDYEQDSPVDVLKDFQTSILAVTGQIPQGVAGTNVWEANEADIKKFIEANITDVCINDLTSIVNEVNDKESAIAYLLKNVMQFKAKAKHLNGIKRVDMPQTSKETIARAAAGITDMSEAFFDNDEDLVEIESTEIDAVDASDVEIITPTRSTDLTAQMSEAEIITLNRIKDVSDDIADAIKKYYDIDADPRLITADIIQDLNLIAGKIRPEDLEPTFVNNITKEMYRSYNEFYEFADGLFSALTGETIHTTPEQKFVQAIRTLNSPAFSKETIDKTIGSRRFLTAARSGQIPYLNTAELPQLGEAAVCEKCHKAVCECDKTDLDEAVERYMIVTRTFNQGPDSNEVEVEKFVANSKEEADQKYEELVNMNLYDEVDQPIECFGEALALDQLTDATPDTSLVNTIRTAYTNGMLHKLRNIDGRNNAYYIDLMDIDRARLEAFFDKRDEFSKEINNEGGILSTEYISDILDIEFFPTFMSIYRIPQNECLEEGVKKVTAQQFIDVLNGKDVVTESVNNPEPFDALDRKSRNIELYYEDVEVPYAYGARSWEDGSYEHEGEAIIDTSYYLTPYEAAEVLWDIVTDEEAERFEDVSDDDYVNVVEQYIVDNLDDLIDKYMDNLLDYFREDAEQEAAENYDPTEYDGPEYEPDDYYDYYDESVNVDLNPFVHQINEYFDESYEDTVVFEATTGSVDAHGNIVVEGLLRSDSTNSDVKFDLTPVKPLTEALTAATAGDVISKTIYRVTNNLSEESFTFSFKD